MSKKEYNNVAIKVTLQRYWREIKHEWKAITILVVASGIGSILIFYVPPLVVAQLVATRKDIHNIEEIIPYLLIFGLSWISGELLWRLALHFMIKSETRILRRLYVDSLNEVAQKDISFFNDNFTGSLTKRIGGYGHRFIQFLDTIIFNITSNFIPTLFAGIILWFISPYLVLALIILLSMGALIVIPMIRKRMVLVQKREEAATVASGHVADIMTNITAVKSFANEKSELKTYKKYVDDYAKKAEESWHYQNNRIDMAISPFYVFTNVIGLAIALLLGEDSVSKATIFISFSYFSTITRFFWEFSSIYRRLEESVTEASLLVEHLIEPPKINDAISATSLRIENGLIEIKDVDFSHKEDKSILFRNFSLVIQPGQKIGLVGHSGAGKSTITNLLLRFMDVQNGVIEIDGQNIADVTQESLRQSIAYVPQEPMLFHRSLRENIAYGKPDASDEEVRMAAKKAHALEFIETLPDGFDTLVGERGVKLSGGQRQRIAIARAILKDAPILVLDEATSALDSESERLIQLSLKNLMKQRTSIVIAHRLSTISHLDRIIVLDNGRIVEDGTHKTLLEKNGTYASLWNHQSGGFLEE